MKHNEHKNQLVALGDGVVYCEQCNEFLTSDEITQVTKENNVFKIGDKVKVVSLDEVGQETYGDIIGQTGVVKAFSTPRDINATETDPYIAVRLDNGTHINVWTEEIENI